MKHYYTPRKGATGLGSARSGTAHHWAMTVSAVALAVLTPLFLWAVGSAIGRPLDQVLRHFSHPFPAVVTALFIAVGMVHFIRGTRIMFEDYLRGTALVVGLIVSTLFGWAVIAAAVYALVKIALIGTLV